MNEAKTHIVDATETSFEFLGFSIRMSRGRRSGKPYPHMCPSPAKSLMKIKTHAEQRLRAHLMKRHGVHDRRIGEGRFPSVQLYRRYGLIKLPTVAGWRPAHA